MVSAVRVATSQKRREKWRTRLFHFNAQEQPRYGFRVNRAHQPPAKLEIFCEYVD